MIPSSIVIHTTTPPPMDGRVFIALCAVVYEDQACVVSEPFVGRVYVDGGELRTAISGSYRMSLRSSPDDVVHIHGWAPMAQGPARRIDAIE
ncbi:MAG: hypothetical protein E6Q97_00070 [Desulfurellales bacterium]|nr:MAG: hypothetical protein E6Q97_00070 [Desulfurellales bacterium]